MDMDPIMSLNESIQTLARQLASHPLNVNGIQGYGGPQCGTCGAMGHLSNQCYEGNPYQSFQPFQEEALNYGWNQQGPQYNEDWNSYSNSYNPEWGTHPSYGWESYQYQPQAPFQEPNPSYYSNSWGPPGIPFQDFEQNSNPQPQYQQEERGMDLEDMVRKCVEESQEMKQAFHDLSTQFGQLVQLLHNGPQETLHRDIEMNSREVNEDHVKDVCLDIDEVKASYQNKKGVDVVGQTLLDGLFNQEKAQFEGILHQEPKAFEAKTSLKHSLEELEPQRQEPLVEWMKKIEEVEPVYLSEECSSWFNHLSPKLKDPGTFSIPCTIGKYLFSNSLCDLGAGVNIMPFEIYQMLGLGEIKSTNLTLRLADWSVKKPRGVVENVLVRVHDFVFSTDFVILDMCNVGCQLILGRPFLAITGSLIDVQKGELILRRGNDYIVFNMFEPFSYPCHYGSYVVNDFTNDVGCGEFVFQSFPQV